MLEALQLRRKDNDIEGMFASMVHLSQFYKSQSNLDRAKHWSEQLKTIADSLNSPDMQLEAMQLLFETKPDLSREQFLTYKNLRDSIETTQSEYAFRFAKITYDYEEERQKAQKLEIASQKSDYQRKNAIIVAISVFVLSFLLFLMQRQRAKRKQLEERYVTESKISKRVHDVIANDMFSIRAELAIQKTKESTLNKLDDLYERTRDISKEYSPVNTGSNYFQTLSDMLRGMLSQDVKLIFRGSENIRWSQVSHNVKLALYRSLQELMINMKKHSNATAVVIAFAKAQNKVIIDYKDNGTTESEYIKKGSGLQNVESRISDLKGSFTFEINKDIGCEASIEIPV